MVHVKGVTGLTLRLQHYPGGGDVGDPIIPVIDGVSTFKDVEIEMKNFRVDLDAAYMFKVTYVNSVADGDVAPGGLVNYKSPPFYFVSEEGDSCRTETSASPSGSATPENSARLRDGAQIRVLLVVGVFCILGLS
jgi:hypothetical protein